LSQQALLGVIDAEQPFQVRYLLLKRPTDSLLSGWKAELSGPLEHPGSAAVPNFDLADFMASHLICCSIRLEEPE
jgi:hypothetical protein